MDEEARQEPGAPGKLPAASVAPAEGVVAAAEGQGASAESVEPAVSCAPPPSPEVAFGLATPPSSEREEDPAVASEAAPPGLATGRRRAWAGAWGLASAFLLGAAVMGVVTVFVVRSERRKASAAVAAIVAAIPPPLSVIAVPIVPDDAGAAPATEAAAPAPPVFRVASLGSDATVQLVQGEIGKRTLLAALSASGLPRVEAFRVLKAFEGVKSFDRAGAKDTFSFARDRDNGKVVAFEFQSSPIDIWQARDRDGSLEAKKLELPVDERRVAVGVSVGDDLRASIVAAGLDDDMLKMLDDALEGHAELADLRPGARLRLVATEERMEGTFVRYSDLDAVEYTPANPQAPKLRVYWYGKAPPTERGPHAHAGGFYDAKGQQPYHGGFRTPVPLARIASRFNPHRMHPILHVIMPHNGVDFAAPTGTPIYATAAGVVKTAGDGGPCGNMVQIQHANGLVSSYCHMSRFAAGLHAGQHVEQRQLVGYVGQTGRATGPHLHFAIKRGDVFLDPLAFKLDGVRVLPPSMRDDFAKTRVQMDLALEGIPMPALAPGSPAAADGGAGTEETVFDDSPGLE